MNSNFRAMTDRLGTSLRCLLLTGVSAASISGCGGVLYGGQDNTFRAALDGDVASIDAYYSSGDRSLATDFSGRTLFHWHAAQGNEYGVRAAIDSGLPVDLLLQPANAVGNVYKNRLAVDRQEDATPLYLAVQQGHREMGRVLIDAGADPLVRTRDGSTTLIAAAHSADAALIDRLLALGVDPNATNSAEDTALIVAAWGEDLPDSAFHLMGVPTGRSPSAILVDSEDAVRSLLAAGALVNAQNRRGETGLYRGAQNGQIGAARLLLDSGADIDHVTSEGRSAMMMAAAAGHIDVVALLAERGAQPMIVETRIFDFRAVSIVYALFADRMAQAGDRQRGMEYREISERYAEIYAFLTTRPDSPYLEQSIVVSYAYEPERGFTCVAAYGRLRAVRVYREEGGLTMNASFFDDSDDMMSVADCSRSVGGAER